MFIAKSMLTFESFDRNVTISFFLLHFFPFCYIFILQLMFFQKNLTTSPEEIFFMDIEKPFTFFMVKEDMKSNHNNLLLFDY